MTECCTECCSEQTQSWCCPNFIAWDCITLDTSVAWQVKINAKCPPTIDSPLETIDVVYDSINNVYHIERKCCDDRLVWITQADTCPWHLWDKLLVSSPLTRIIQNQWACEKYVIWLNTALLPDKDEKVSIDWICTAWYLKDQICTDECSWMIIKQQWCCLNFWLDDKHFQWAFIKVYLTSDLRVSYPASTPPLWAWWLPNQWFRIDDFSKQSFYWADETWIFTIEPVSSSWWDATYWITINCDWFYRVSHKWAVDINYWVNAFRKIVFLYDPILWSTFCLDSKYWEPEQSPVNFLAEFDGADDPNSLKQFQIGQSEVFYLSEWSQLYAWWRMDNTVLWNAPAHLWWLPRPWIWKDWLVIVRHAWLSSWILQDDVVSRPESWYSWSVEYIWDYYMDRRSCKRCG